MLGGGGVWMMRWEIDNDVLFLLIENTVRFCLTPVSANITDFKPLIESVNIAEALVVLV